jgi:hypothetical protein
MSSSHFFADRRPQKSMRRVRSKNLYDTFGAPQLEAAF